MASSVFRYFDQHDAVDNGLKKDSRSSAGINAPVKNEGDLLEKKTDLGLRIHAKVSAFYEEQPDVWHLFPPMDVHTPKSIPSDRMVHLLASDPFYFFHVDFEFNNGALGSFSLWKAR